MSPDLTMNMQRRQRQNNSLLVPSDKNSSKLSNFNATGVHRVSLRSIANSGGELPHDLSDNFLPPRVGRSLAPTIRQPKGGVKGNNNNKSGNAQENKFINSGY